MISVSKKHIVLALTLSLTLLLSPFTAIRTVQAATLKDLSQCADYAKPSVSKLAQNEVITGDQNGYFNPRQSITRAQMVTLIVKSLGLDKTVTPDNNNTFNDVPKNHWANKYVEIAYQKGITRGVGANQFGADQTCNREQMITLYVNSLKLMDDQLVIPSSIMDLSRFSDAANISDWAHDPLAFSVYMGLISGTSTTTIDPKAAAQRQQVAVLTDRFIDKKVTIINDMKAQRLLGKAMDKQFNGEGISNSGNLEIKVKLQDGIAGLPSELSLKAQVTSDMIWPDQFHQSVNVETTGLPEDSFPAVNMEQYLVDGVLYQKTINENNQVSWKRMPQSEVPDAENLMQSIKDAQTSQLILPEDIHKTADVTLEDVQVNGEDGYRITYNGEIEDVSALLDQLSATIPVSESEVQNILDTIKESVSTIHYSEVYLVGADNLIYGTQYRITINCNPDDTQLVPVKTIEITGNSDSYKYNDIQIVLPAEAKAAL